MKLSKAKIIIITIAAILLSALSIYLMVNDNTPCAGSKKAGNNTAIEKSTDDSVEY